MQKKKRGFTLIELLIVIAIIAILAAVAFVALDPLSRFQDARDSARWADVNAIISAIRVDQVDNKGLYIQPITDAIAGTTYMIGAGAAGTCAVAAAEDTCAVATNANCIDLDVAGVGGVGLVEEGYLGEMPVSPQGDSSITWDSNKVGYALKKNANGSVTIIACENEGVVSQVAEPIIVTR